MTLTATQRAARYAAQPAVTGNGHETLTPAQRRRIRHKRRHAGAAPARLAGNAAAAERRAGRAARLEERARQLFGLRARQPVPPPPPAPLPAAAPWASPGHDVAADLRAVAERGGQLAGRPWLPRRVAK